MYFNMRERQILEILLKNQNVPIRIYDMAQHLAVSSRTIHRELKSLEKSLATLDTELIRQKKQRGFY
ncbi:helix-turn-helix domain-containing protein [Staphylococcus chromogenes]|uniref:helix-turn-helix domain-containing protein n=1 Tax=Staphylococcus chromogenes TaxID=46126 RepID=UPI003AFF941C